MNHKQALTTAIFAISALATTAAQASYYRLYGRAQYQIFFGTSDNRQVDEVNGIKSWADAVSGSNPSDYARTDMTVKFGNHRGSILCQGLFSNAYGEARTEEDVMFSNPLGFPVRVRANLVGAATVGHPNQTQTQRASSTLSINGVVRIGYLDQYIGNSHQTNTPVPYEFEVPSGGTIWHFDEPTLLCELPERHPGRAQDPDTRRKDDDEHRCQVSTGRSGLAPPLGFIRTGHNIGKGRP